MKINLLHLAFAFGLLYALKKRNVLYVLSNGKWKKLGYITNIVSINEETGVIVLDYTVKRGDDTKGGRIYANMAEVELRKF